MQNVYEDGSTEADYEPVSGLTTLTVLGVPLLFTFSAFSALLAIFN